LAIRPCRQLLHAVELGFAHPTTGQPVVFAAPPPPDIVYAG
jgi:23S rRNA-/tRNA-specific pseudouridylate synthase